MPYKNEKVRELRAEANKLWAEAWKLVAAARELEAEGDKAQVFGEIPLNLSIDPARVEKTKSFTTSCRGLFYSTPR